MRNLGGGIRSKQVIALVSLLDLDKVSAKVKQQNISDGHENSSKGSKHVGCNGGLIRLRFFLCVIDCI